MDARRRGAVVEELELEPASDPEQVAAFLRACGLAAAETERAVDAIAETAGSALLRVKRRGEHTTFEVTEPAADESRTRLTRPSGPPIAVLAN